MYFFCTFIGKIKLTYLLTYLHLLYMNISYYKNLHIYIYILSQHIHMMVTLASHSNNLSQLCFTSSLSLVETAYPIVNMVQVINKEARAT